MTQTIEAVYQDGFFKPLEPLEIILEEGQIVLLTITTIKESDQDINLQQNQISS